MIQEQTSFLILCVFRIACILSLSAGKFKTHLAGFCFQFSRVADKLTDGLIELWRTTGGKRRT